MKIFTSKPQTFESYRSSYWKHSILLVAFLSTLLTTTSLHSQTLVWEENFNGTSINEDVWTYDFGDGCERGLCGWGNSELQYYTSRADNARVESGNLIIEAKREAFGARQFTSARIKTEGRVHFTYGTLEARIKMPDLANGLWPAFWMLGTTGTWPQNGEIDILEMGSAAAIQEGLVNKKAGAAVHWSYNGSQADYGTDYDNSANLNNDYHVYKMTWTPEYIKIFIDNIEYFEIDISDIEGNSMEEFHIPHFIILNLAVGGTYTGIMTPEGITAPLPGQMLVDYVKLYQDNNDNLYLGSNNEKSGTFGVYTENTPVNSALTYGEDADIYIWNNMTPITASPYEGSESLAFNVSTGQWYGMGVATDYLNLSNFYEGELNFNIKTTSTETFKIGISTGHGDSWLDFVNGGEQFGLVRDGNWHKVSIPLGSFYNLDLNSVKQVFMITGNSPASDIALFIDNIYYSGGGESNLLPEISITSPSEGAEFVAGAAVAINVNTSDTDGTVDLVEFFSNGNKIGEDANAPFGYTWNNTVAGTYTLTAKATDSGGASNTSSSVTVSITETSSGSPIPGLLQAEDYDAMSGIQTEATSDIAGGQNIGWIDSGDWLEYEVNVADAGTYTVDLRVASLSGGGQFQLLSESQIIANGSIPSTGGWQNWTTISTTVDLSTGSQTFRILASAGGWNINWMEFSAGSAEEPGCSFVAATGDYSADVSEDNSNTSITFVPERSGVGTTTAILYYGTSPTASLPGYMVSANTPFQINAAQGQTIYFYYTYNVPEGGERNTANNKHSFTVGNCNTSTFGGTSAISTSEQKFKEQAITESFILYPNPTKGSVVVPEKFIGGTVEITNTIGNEVLHRKITSSELDLAALPSGVYTILIRKGDVIITKKLIKQ